MAAYVISDVEMVDPELFEKYRALAPATIAQYGGRYLVRGGKIQTIEGDWKPKQIVIVEFPTMQRALEWYRSPRVRRSAEGARKSAKQKPDFCRRRFLAVL
jgi:uncharacterized protein (DUF1330 family)